MPSSYANHNRRTTSNSILRDSERTSPKHERLRGVDGYDAQRRLVAPDDAGALTAQVSSWLPQIAQGRSTEAKGALHTLAIAARAAGDSDSADVAGELWQLADALEKATAAVTDRNYADAKRHAANTGSLARALGASPQMDANAIERIVTTAGGLWTTADKAPQQADSDGSRTPIVDQHRLNHERSGAFCGIATMLMVLRANGKNPPADTRGQLQSLAQGIYHAGQGTSGSGMAQRLRDHGVKDSTYTTNGTLSHVVTALQAGQPVPLGVLHTVGEVAALNDGGSKRYPHLRVGSRHEHRYGASGHWLTVVSFEGKPEQPTGFLINDPDAGARLRVTPAELKDMAAANVGGSGMWMVRQ